MEGWKEARKDGWMGRWPDRKVEKWMDGLTNRWKNKQSVVLMDRQIDKFMNLEIYVYELVLANKGI